MLLGRRQYKRRLLMHKSPRHVGTRTHALQSPHLGSQGIQNKLALLSSEGRSPYFTTVSINQGSSGSSLPRRSARILASGSRGSLKAMAGRSAVGASSHCPLWNLALMLLCLARLGRGSLASSESPPRPRREVQRLAVHLPWGGLGEGKDSPLQGLTGGYGLHPVLLCRNKVRAECLPGSRYQVAHLCWLRH